MGVDTSFQRMAVIGIGQFGLRLMAYLWPRIRFQALQREVFRQEGHSLQRHLPYLRDLISFILVLPTPDGVIHIGHPNPDRWDEDLFIRGLLEAESGEPPWEPDMLADAYELPVELDTEGLMTRSGLFGTAMGAEAELVEHLSWLLRTARLDEAAPGQEVVRFTVYLAAGLGEEPASALLWPLAVLSRRALGEHLGSEIIGCLSTDVEGRLPESLRAAAVAWASLCELETFATAPPDAQPAAIPPQPRWRSALRRPAFDLCFLLDGEKEGGAVARGRDEIIVALGNMLEAFLVSDLGSLLLAFSGPDQEELWRNGRYSTMGAVSLYIPVDEWRARYRYRHELDILKEAFLAPAEEVGERREEADQLTEGILDLRPLLQRLLAGTPLEVVPLGQRGDLADALAAAELGVEESPVPEVVVTDQVLQVDYTVPGLEVGEREPLPLWSHLVQAAEHFAHLGLPWQPVELQEFLPEMTRLRQEDIFLPTPMLTAALGGTSPPEPTQMARWWDQLMAHAGIAMAPGEEMGVMAPSGWLQEMDRRLDERVQELLLTSNRGLVRAIVLLEALSRRLEEQRVRLESFSRRVEQAVTGSAERTRRDGDTRRRLAYRQWVSRQPRLGALVTRMILLSLFSVVLLLQALAVQVGIRLTWPASLLPLLITLFLAGLGTGLPLFICRWRLGRARERVERDMARRLHLALNARLLAMLWDGLLPDVSDLLSRKLEALYVARRGLVERLQDLERELTGPLTLREPFVRRPLPGLEELEARLIAEAEREPLPDSLLRMHPAGAAEQLPGLWAQEQELAILRRERKAAEAAVERGEHPWLVERRRASPQGEEEAVVEEVLQMVRQDAAQREAEIRRRYPYLKHSSVGDLLLSAIEGYVTSGEPFRVPTDVRLEALLRERPGFDPRAFVEEEHRRARPFMAVDDALVEPSFPTRFNGLVVDDPLTSCLARQDVRQPGVRIATSLDPFSVTYVRTLHGLTAASLIPFRRYRRAFRALLAQDREAVALRPEWLGPGGPYGQEMDLLPSSESK